MFCLGGSREEASLDISTASCSVVTAVAPRERMCFSISLQFGLSTTPPGQMERQDPAQSTADVRFSILLQLMSSHVPPHSLGLSPLLLLLPPGPLSPSTSTCTPPCPALSLAFHLLLKPPLSSSPAPSLSSSIRPCLSRITLMVCMPLDEATSMTACKPKDRGIIQQEGVIIGSTIRQPHRPLILCLTRRAPPLYGIPDDQEGSFAVLKCKTGATKHRWGLEGKEPSRPSRRHCLLRSGSPRPLLVDPQTSRADTLLSVGCSSSAPGAEAVGSSNSSSIARYIKHSTAQQHSTVHQAQHSTTQRSIAAH